MSMRTRSAMLLVALLGMSADGSRGLGATVDSFLRALKQHGNYELGTNYTVPSAEKDAYIRLWKTGEKMLLGREHVFSFDTRFSINYYGEDRERPTGTNDLSTAQAIDRTRSFLTALGYDLASIYVDLDPREMPLVFDSSNYVSLAWYHPGLDNIESFTIEWARKPAQIVHCFFTYSKPPTNNASAGGNAEGSWAWHLAGSPRDLRAIKEFAPILPELKPVLEILKTNAFDTPQARQPFKPGFTTSISTLDGWSFWLDSGKLGGFATPDRLFLNPNAGWWTHTMKRPSKLGEAEAIERVVAAIRKLGRKDIADWCEVSRPKIYQPNTYGTTRLSRIRFEWNTPESPKQSVAVRAEVDTASGELKSLRFVMEPPEDEPPKEK